jgi:arsenite methyltransferase
MRMEHRLSARRRGSYGVDAPYGPILMGTMVVVYLVLAIQSGQGRRFLPVIFMGAILAAYLDATLRGKFVVWGQLLNQLNLRGDERILDLGCGRGAVLLMAAQHLTTGRAVGADLWRKVDQSGNSIEATRRNALAEGVADRVELHTTDMTALPFANNSFDVVVSSMAIHNINTAQGRKKAIEEAVRVLRPGGRLMIADVRATGFYQKQLESLRMCDVKRRRLGWQFWRGGASAVTLLVTATKPKSA